MIDILSDNDVKEIQQETWAESNFDDMEDRPRAVMLKVAEHFRNMTVAEYRVVLENTDDDG